MIDYTIFNNIIYRTDGSMVPKKETLGTAQYDWGIPPMPSEIACAANGEGTGNIPAGTYKVHAVAYASQFGMKGMPYSNDPVEVTIEEGNNAIAVTSIPTLSDPQVSHVMIYRTMAGQEGPFYFAGWANNGDASIVLNGNDDTLPTNDVLEPAGYGTVDETYLSMAGPFAYERPPLKSRVASWDGRLWVAGETPYTTGLVSPTNNSETWVGTNTTWHSRMVGQTIKIDDEALAYTITEVVDTTHLKTTPPYQRPDGVDTDPSEVTYEIKGDPLELHYSEQGRGDNFSFDSILRVGDAEGGEIVEVTPYHDQFLVFKDRSVWAVYMTGDPRFPYGLQRTESEAGCAAADSVVIHNGQAFWYSGDNFYTLDGIQSVPIGDPLGDWPRDILQKNTVSGDSLHGRIYWAVSLSNPEYCDTILVYDVRRGMWDLPWTGMRIGQVRSGIVNNRQYLFFTEYSDAGAFWLSRFDDNLTSDVVATCYEGNPTSATADTITDTTQSFSVDSSLLGAPVYIRSGTGAGQVRFIESNDSQSLTVSEDWTTTPDTTSEYVVGLIRQSITGKDEVFGSPHDEKRFQALECEFY